jgi:hypothetical protein
MAIYASVSEKARQEMIERSAEGAEMVRRIDLLGGAERALMMMYLEKGTSFRQRAELARVNEVTISRRVHKIFRRLMDTRYGRCLGNKEMFTKYELAIAKEHFVRGKSIRAMSKDRSTTYHRMRGTVKRIEGILELLNEKKHPRHSREA